ncbi:uncharacterized protein LOC111627477 [Centruroides sculpturatus]|uniref:uncharacterized protein LOC111627477 n=1 Tax=Centruroides sculpturatus TaxID=218467 RepID=UPI000C6EE45D|nr:uncharacterized protein LOC111627477 [Centruroides sculpturatus]
MEKVEIFLILATIFTGGAISYNYNGDWNRIPYFFRNFAPAETPNIPLYMRNRAYSPGRSSDAEKAPTDRYSTDIDYLLHTAVTESYEELVQRRLESIHTFPPDATNHRYKDLLDSLRATG